MISLANNLRLEHFTPIQHKYKSNMCFIIRKFNIDDPVPKDDDIIHNVFGLDFLFNILETLINTLGNVHDSIYTVDKNNMTCDDSAKTKRAETPKELGEIGGLTLVFFMPRDIFVEGNKDIGYSIIESKQNG